MIKFQDFWLKTTESSVATPDRTVNLKGGLVDVTLVAGQRYPVRGRMSPFDGLDYVVVGTSNNPIGYQAVLVKPDGTLHNRVAVAGPALSGLVVVVYNLTRPSLTLRRKWFARRAKALKRPRDTRTLNSYTPARTRTDLTSRIVSSVPDGLAKGCLFKKSHIRGRRKNHCLQEIPNSRGARVVGSRSPETFTVLADGQ